MTGTHELGWPDEIPFVGVPATAQGFVTTEFLHYGVERDWVTRKEADRWLRENAHPTGSNALIEIERRWAVLILVEILRRWDRLDRPVDLARSISSLFATDAVPEIGRLRTERTRKVQKAIILVAEEYGIDVEVAQPTRRSRG